MAGNAKPSRFFQLPVVVIPSVSPDTQAIQCTQLINKEINTNTLESAELGQVQ